MARVLAIDCGATTGIAWSEDGTLHPDRSGLWLFAGYKVAGDRYVALIERLKKAEIGVPTHIAFEDAFSKSKAGTRWFNGYRAVCELYAAWVGAEFMPIAPLSLKKWATGIGLAPKADREADPQIEKTRMRSALCWKYPHLERLDSIDQNRIDALWVLAWAIERVKS